MIEVNSGEKLKEVLQNMGFGVVLPEGRRLWGIHTNFIITGKGLLQGRAFTPQHFQPARLVGRADF